MAIVKLLLPMLLILFPDTSSLAQDMPPQITSIFKDVYYLVEGNQEPIHFKCSANGKPEPKYEWYKDGNKVQNSLQVTVDETTGYLSIIRAQVSLDFGKYQCFAINSMGTAISVVFEIKRAFIGPFSDRVPRTLVPVNEYETVSIKCVGKPSCVPDSDCIVEWIRGEGTSNKVQENKRIAIDAEGTLHFLSVELSDQSTSAVPYACGIDNTMMKALYKGGNVIMPVNRVTIPTPYKPTVKFVTQTVKGLRNEQAELQCVFSGYPLPDIEWYTKDDILIREDSKYSFRQPDVRRNLIIKGLSQDDEGTYRCVGINMLGKADASIYLNVTSQPMFTEGGQLLSQVVPMGKDALFTCRMQSMKGERLPSAPTWRRNGIILPEDQVGSNPSQKYQLSTGKTELTIKNVQKPGDSCSITCETGNVIFDVNGQDRYVQSYGSATLRIIDPITVSVLSDFVTELEGPTPFSMAISYTTDPSMPNVKVEWSLLRPDNETIISDAELRTKDWVDFNGGKINLTIFPSKATNENEDDRVREVVGLYSVKVFHTYDSVVKSFKVFTNIKPKGICPTEVIVYSSVASVFVIIVVVGIAIFVCRRRRLVRKSSNQRHDDTRISTKSYGYETINESSLVDSGEVYLESVNLYETLDSSQRNNSEPYSVMQRVENIRKHIPIKQSQETTNSYETEMNEGRVDAFVKQFQKKRETVSATYIKNDGVCFKPK